MFQHSYAILRERSVSLWVTWTLRIINSHVVSTQKVAYINSYIHCILLDYNITIAAFQVTHKTPARSLRMAYEGRNL
jgi:hypothetical protein